MFLISPLDHLEGPHDIKRHARQGEPSKDIKSKPRHNFAEIIWRVHKLKKEPSGEHNSVPTFLTKLRKHNVADEIEDHKSNKPRTTEVNTPGWRLHPISGSVDVPADKESSSIVIGTIFEKVENRHCEGPKLVDKDSLKLSLEVVDVPKDKGKLLSKIEVHLGVLVVKERGETEGKDGVYHNGAEILDKIDGSEGNLRTKVFENNLSAFFKTVLGKSLVAIGVKNDDVGLGSNGKSLTRNRYLGFLVNGLLEIDNLGVPVNFHGGEELEVTLENFNLHFFACEGACLCYFEQMLSYFCCCYFLGCDLYKRG